ncbi:MAG: SurA N-terminal domain-containing protein [Paracoccus sp. (in: a-proteobacteria)]|uniref:peptidylprolyl isomerase n=1 Tax=Paracoccus sp. TaxID=267 RepID=UPI00391D13A6
MANLRTKGKSTVVWILMGLMVLGLGGFGVTSFSGGSTAIGQVGETRVTADEYARALRGEMMAITRQTGQPLSMAEAQAMGVPQAVQASLFTAAALAEQARGMGVSVGDEQVAKTILAAEAFRGPNGRFDRAAYAEVLRRERLSEADFEAAVRADESRMLLQRAVAGGVVAPAPVVDQTTRWVLETRDFSWRELTEADLPAPVAEPDEATLEAWHAANAGRFTTPERRRISYAWVTPQMLAAEVTLDEAALRAVYDQNIDEFQQPERRMVSRLIFASEAEAQTAADAVAVGEQPFEAFVLQRGLTLDDIDLGAVSEAQLGAAGAQVFALDQNGVVGPVQTDLGWALFSVNAILDPVDVPFEEAREGLRAEAALSRAVRLIQDRTPDYEDLLAGGASIEDLAAETEMQADQIDWNADEEPAEGSIAGYQSFRDRAADISESDFPELLELADGGVFTLRLDEVVPPALIPFDEVRDAVLADWREAEVQRQLLELADDLRVAALSDTVPANGDAPVTGGNGVVQNPVPQNDPAVPAPPQDAVQPEAGAQDDPQDDPWTTETGLTRDAWVQDLPQPVMVQAFEIDEPGEVEVVDAGNLVLLVRLDQIGDADLSGEDAQMIQGRVAERVSQSLQGDIFDYYARHVQREQRIEVNQSAINAVNTQVQ